MNSPTLHQHMIQKFCEEYLASISPLITRASKVSLVQRWEVFFQCSIAPSPGMIDPELLDSMLNLYQVASLDGLLPKYLGVEEQWGAIVSPRVATDTGAPIACIEHWFVTDPKDLTLVVESVKQHWPFPFEAIWIPLCPEHRCASFLAGWENARLEECVYVADWGCSRPEVLSLTKFSQFTCSMNQELNAWWPDLFRELDRDGSPLKSEHEVLSLKRMMESCLQTGGILNLYDYRGLAAHVSWLKGSEAELLIPQCWIVPYIFVRDDLRGQGFAKHLYALASQHMALDEIPLVCARVQAENLPSQKVLEAVGVEKVLDYYTVGREENQNTPMA
ncbi:MAG: hypothetical protein O2999_07600 [Nitrospirae bacterium]|nr:hypothetical protein [Nitrospirota bacterium]MDA1304150.1 hypothetical protein [Nitrospirota bacterium]